MDLIMKKENRKESRIEEIDSVCHKFIYFVNNVNVISERRCHVEIAVFYDFHNKMSWQ